LENPTIFGSPKTKEKCVSFKPFTVMQCTQILKTENKTIAIAQIHRDLPWKPKPENQQPI
jgi:hypothetical protein